MKIHWIVLLVAGFPCVAADWHHPLSYDNGGYWPVRVQVEVTNPTANAMEGAAVTVPISPENATKALIGQAVASLRVVAKKDKEFVFDVRSAENLTKHEGLIAAGDLIDIPVEAPAQGAAELFIYAGNAQAWAPPEWLPSVLVNTGFERAEDGTPTHWRAGGADTRHRMSWAREGVHSGAGCARCDVDAGAEPTWVQYSQGGLSLHAGARYRFTGWVKGENVQGKAGWYVHVGGQDLLVNRVEGAAGTFDWREIAIEFEVPAEGRTFSCGTVLHGTGAAWYDDARLELAPGTGQIQVNAKEAIVRQLRPIGADAPWPEDPAWRWRAPLQVRRFDESDGAAGVVSFDVRHLRNRMAKLLGFTANPELLIVDPAAPGQDMQIAGSFEEQVQVATGAQGASMPGNTEKTLWLYLRAQEAGAPAPVQSPRASLAEWAALPMNLVKNGAMEAESGGALAEWAGVEQARSDPARFTARRAEGAVQGAWCAELDVAKEVEKPAWIGWRQLVSVKPSTRYFLSGYIKTQGTDVAVAIHAHLKRADGSFTESPFLGTGPAAEPGDHDWMLTSTSIVTPADCAAIELHLTMNGHGSVWHDGILLVEASTGCAGEIEARAPQSAPLAVWNVNPLVKVFREDLPPDASGEGVTIHSARNEWEAFQLALRATAPMDVEVAISPLRGPGGAVLPAVEMYRVGYVPIDFPVGYDSTTEPPHHRFLPTRRGNDGWPGLWPDPLEPIRDGKIRMAAGETQPVLFDVRAPADTAPGVYEGVVTLRGGSSAVDIPVKVTVWDLVLPEQRHLPALYDLRSGPGMNIFSAGVDVSTWDRFLARYNVSPSFVMPSPNFAYANGQVTMDAAAFDENAHYLFDVLHVSKVYTPDLFYACGWAYSPKGIFGLKAFTPEYVEAWSSAYWQFIDHLTAKGWRDRFVLYLSDEPFDSSEVTIAGLARLADLARAIAPDVPVYSSTWHYIGGLAGHLSQWGIGPHGSFTELKREERRAAGDALWFTTDGQMCTDTPLLGIERLLPWFCHKYSVGAYEFWGVSWWTYNPWERGWHTYIRQSDQGKEFYSVRYPNGDGYLTYPPRSGEHEPLPSIRLVAARDGVDDYELFLALGEAARQGDVEAQKALDSVHALVSMPNPGGRYSTAILHDPEAVLAARAAAGEALARRATPAQK